MSRQTIWNKLRAKGFSENAAAAIMGNMQGESGLVSYRLQGDYDWETNYKWSQDYTAAVDNGKISKAGFLYEGPCGGGYGLCQWTFWSRKEGLYDTAKSLGVSIGSEEAQIDWLYVEIQQPSYKEAFDSLMSDDSLYDMTTAVLRIYEKPHDQSDAVARQRTAYAEEILRICSGTVPDPEPQPQPAPEPEPVAVTADITVPVLKKGDKGVAVAMMQKGLDKNKISLGVWGCDGDFGTATYNAVKKFQKQSNLKDDGIVGHDTWQVLFQ